MAAVNAEASARAAEFAREADRVCVELDRAITNAGLEGDALGAVLRSLSSTARVISEMPVAILNAAQQPAVLSPEKQDRLISGLRHEHRMAVLDWLRQIRWPTMITAVCLALASFAGTAIGAYWWGVSSARADIAETEAGLRAAFRDRPAAARDWLNLIQWNDAPRALAQCKGQAVSVQDGRRACAVPLWIAPPQTANTN